MSEKIKLTISFDAAKQRKLKNLEFSVSIYLSKIPKNTEELDSEFAKKKMALDVLETSLQEIMLHNENLMEYIRLHKGDPESELNKREIVESASFSLQDHGVITNGRIVLEDGSFHQEISIKKFMDSVMDKIKSRSENLLNESSL